MAHEDIFFTLFLCFFALFRDDARRLGDYLRGR
jgi:hypothetical protein